MGVTWGHGGTIQIASWKGNSSVYLDMQVYYFDIPAITTLLCLLLVLYVLVPSIYSIFYLTTALLKSDIFLTQKPTRTVFNLQASDWVHCEEEAGAYYQLSLITSKFLSFFIFIIKVAFFAPQKYAIFKKFHTVYYNFFFQKEIIGHTYIFTKCTGNFKFTISLKSYEE